MCKVYHPAKNENKYVVQKVIARGKIEVESN